MTRRPLVPTTAEGLQSSSELLFPERSNLARYFGDRREPGAMLDYSAKPIRLRLMASNGQVSPGSGATNIDDANNSKDINARVDYSLAENLILGAFGNQSSSTLGLSQRQGLNAIFSLERLWTAVEGVQGRELDVHRSGLAANVAYQLSEQFQAAFRYENFQRKTTRESSSNAYVLGLNYFLSGHNLKVQLAHTILNNMIGANGTISPSASQNGSLTVLNIQSAL